MQSSRRRTSNRNVKPETNAAEKYELQRLEVEFGVNVQMWDVIAALVNLASFGTLLTFYLTNAWDIRSNTVRGKLSVNKIWAFQAEDVQTYDLFPILIAVPAITFFDHSVQFLLNQLGTVDDWFFQDYMKGFNRIRWLFYAISASLMNWIILSLSGVVNVFLMILFAVVLNVLLQLCGYWFEEKNLENFSTLRKNHNYAYLNTTWFWVGCLIFVAQWTFAVVAFFVNVANSSATVPFFVYLVFWVIFACYAFFALIMAARATGCPLFYAPDAYEIAYKILSTTAKLAIDWIVFGGIVASFDS